MFYLISPSNIFFRYIFWYFVFKSNRRGSSSPESKALTGGLWPAPPPAPLVLSRCTCLYLTNNVWRNNLAKNVNAKLWARHSSIRKDWAINSTLEFTNHFSSKLSTLMLIVETMLLEILLFCSNVKLGFGWVLDILIQAKLPTHIRIYALLSNAIQLQGCITNLFL